MIACDGWTIDFVDRDQNDFLRSSSFRSFRIPNKELDACWFKIDLGKILYMKGK